MDSCAFNKLFAKNVPHILENIFLSLDYESYKVCLEVNDTWEKLLSSESYQKIGKSVFRNEILKDEWKLWNVAENGNEIDVKRLLLSKMIDVNSRHGDSLSTPLHQAAEGGNIIVGRLLLDRGADPDGQNRFGRTPLHEAIEAIRLGHKDMVMILLERGAEVNRQTKTQKYTPLHYAVMSGSKGVAQILLEKGANPNKTNVYGITPISLANEYGYTDIAETIANHKRRCS